MIWVLAAIAYVAGGAGAMILADKQNQRYVDDLFSRFENTDFRGVLRYIERKKYMIPKSMNGPKALLALMMGLILWAAWPVIVPLSMIWQLIDYRMTLKEGLEKTRAE